MFDPNSQLVPFRDEFIEALVPSYLQFHRHCTRNEWATMAQYAWGPKSPRTKGFETILINVQPADSPMARQEEACFRNPAVRISPTAVAVEQFHGPSNVVSEAWERLCIVPVRNFYSLITLMKCGPANLTFTIQGAGDFQICRPKIDEMQRALRLAPDFTVDAIVNSPLPPPRKRRRQRAYAINELLEGAILKLPSDLAFLAGPLRDIASQELDDPEDVDGTVFEKALKAAERKLPVNERDHYRQTLCESYTKWCTQLNLDLNQSELGPLSLVHGLLHGYMLFDANCPASVESMLPHLHPLSTAGDNHASTRD